MSSMSFNPAYDVKETENGYEIKFDMDGMDKDNFDVQINEHSLTVKGQRSKENTEQGPNSYFKAQSYGTFMNTIPLPEDADVSKVKTEKERDSLIIRMPKKNVSGKVVPVDKF